MKAIFTAGPPGSGKTTLLKSLNISKFRILNIDNELEKLLKEEIGHMDYSKMSLTELSTAGKLMKITQKNTERFCESLIDMRRDIIIDGTGASSKNLLKKKLELEKLGYETFMLFTYVSPKTSLKRNSKRSRKLPTTSILEAWNKTVSNIDTYRFEFENNICIINNESKEYKKFNIKKLLNKYPMPKGKQKSLVEIWRKEERITLLEQNIINNLNKKIIFDNNLDKIYRFINK